jgi:hypothetical protein
VIKQPPRQKRNKNTCENIQASMGIPERRFRETMRLIIGRNPIAVEIDSALENRCYGTGERITNDVDDQDLASQIETNHLLAGNSQEQKASRDF